MTVPTTTNTVIGTGNGVSTIFPFTYGTLPTGDLVVTLYDLNGVAIPQVENSDYTVQGKGEEDGGSVTFVVAPPSGYKVLTQRILPFTQPTDYKNQGSFYPRTHERSFDRATMQIQQLAEADGRTIKIPPHVQGVSTELPTPIPNGLWGWDAEADAPRYFTPAEIGTTLAFSNFIADKFTAGVGQTDFTLTADPGALANLDVSVDGVTQVPTMDYTLNTTTLTFVTPMVGGEKVLARYGTALPTGITSALAVQFQQAGVGAFVRTSQDKMRERVSLLDFVPLALHADIAAGTSVADVLPYINALASRSSLCIELPQGTIAVNGAINITGTDTILAGKGTRGTIIKQLDATSRTINATGEHSGGEGFMVQGLGALATAGAAIYSFGQYCRWNDIELRNCWDGLHFFDGVGQRATGVVMGGIRNHGLTVEGCIDIFVSDAIIACEPGIGGNPAPLFLKNQVESFCIDTADLLFGKNSIKTQVDVFAHGNRLQPAFSRFTNVFFDTSDEGALLDRMYECDFIGCWFSCGRTGIGFNGATITDCQHIRFTGGNAFTNGRHGVYLRNSSLKVSFTGFSAHGNGITAASSTGIYVEAGTQQFSIIGGIHQNDNASSSQAYGIQIEAGSSDNYVVMGANVLGNLSAGMLDGGTGAGKKIIGNIGYEAPITAPTFLGTWTNLGAPHQTAGYRKDADGIVHLTGVIQGGSIPSAVFTLPAGFRPANQLLYAVNSNAALGRVDVKTNGNVEVSAGGAVFVSLCGISFMASQ